MTRSESVGTSLVYFPDANGNVPYPTIQDINNLCKKLESGNDVARISAMKTALGLLSACASSVNGPPAGITGNLLMTIIRFVMPNQRNKLVKKLVLYFFELVPKTDSEGKLLSEMILLCNALRSDLHHSNEYVRGSTLRFLTRCCHQTEIIEPLVPSIRQCLEHRHAYVRRQAVLAVAAIYHAQGNEALIPDAAETIESMLTVETDPATRRAAFEMLTRVDLDAATRFLDRSYLTLCMVVKDGMKMDAAMQVAIIDFIQRTGGDRVHIINMMLDEDEVPAVVRYQAASALHLSANGFLDPENAQSIASTYVSILLQANDSSNSELTCSDDTCRLVILGRLQNLQSQHHCTILQSHKLLHLIAREDVGISVKTLLISTCVPGISGSHADESINTLISEVQKCHRRSSSAIDDFSKYRKVLLGALNLLAQRFPPSAHVLVTCCIEILYNIASNESSTKSNSRSIADNVIQCLRGLLLRLPALRPAAVAEIVRIMDSVADSHILASLIWMIGEFSKNSGTAVETTCGFDAIITAIGPLPLKSEVVDDDSKDFSQVQPKINADGTYATSVGVDYGKKTKKPSPGKRAVVGVRRSIVEGHRWEVAVAVSEALCKIVVRLCANNKNGGKIKINLISARAMRAVAAVLSFALQPQSSSGEVEGCKKIDRDSYDRMLLVISALSNPAQGPISDSLVSSQKMLAKHCDTYDPVRLLTDEDLVSQGSALAVHQPIPLSPIFLETIGKTEVSCKNTPYSEEAELKRILHSSASVDALSGIKNTTLTKNTKLDHVIQLTGFSDEIYAEAYVTINHQDILLDVLLVSQVDFPILNVNVEVGSSDPAIFCVSERPPPIAMLQPNSFSFVKSSVRVQSTASGFIFGAITYQPSSPQSGSMNSANNTMTIVLADVPIDICEFVRPGTGSDSATKNFKRIGVASLCDEETNALFRSTWIGLEWENKIVIPPLSAECISQLKAVDLDCPDEDTADKTGSLAARLCSHIAKRACLQCITPRYGASEGGGHFLAANLQATSIFGEEILANICLQRSTSITADGEDQVCFTGHLRLRSKTQSIAVALGEKVSNLISSLALKQ